MLCRPVFRVFRVNAQGLYANGLKAMTLIVSKELFLLLFIKLSIAPYPREPALKALYTCRKIKLVPVIHRRRIKYFNKLQCRRYYYCISLSGAALPCWSRLPPPGPRFSWARTRSAWRCIVRSLPSALRS